LVNHGGVPKTYALEQCIKATERYTGFQYALEARAELAALNRKIEGYQLADETMQKIVASKDVEIVALKGKEKSMEAIGMEAIERCLQELLVAAKKAYKELYPTEAACLLDDAITKAEKALASPTLPVEVTGQELHDVLINGVPTGFRAEFVKPAAPTSPDAEGLGREIRNHFHKHFCEYEHAGERSSCDEHAESLVPILQRASESLRNALRRAEARELAALSDVDDLRAKLQPSPCPNAEKFGCRMVDWVAHQIRNGLCQVCNTNHRSVQDHPFTDSVCLACQRRERERRCAK